MNHFSFSPNTVGIELVRGCNFACKMCPVTSNAPSEPEKFQFIDLGLLEQLVEEIGNWPSIDTIWYFHFGEPLAHPDYVECLEILHRSRVAQKAHVIQFTNASLLKGRKAEAILDIPVIRKLVFSFDGFGDKESYERLRGPHYDQVLMNIQEFSYQAKKRRPDLMMSTCTILPRQGEVPALNIPLRSDALNQLYRLFDAIGVKVEVRDMHDYSGNDELTIRGQRPQQVFGGCHFVEQDSLYFTVNGEAQPCCAVYNTRFNVGKFPDQDFAQLLNSSKMNQIRHALRLEHRSDIEFCRNCGLSIGGTLSQAQFEEFWRKREEKGLIPNVAERRQIFGTKGPVSSSVVKLDIGCGSAKPGGFIGLDRIALPGVDIVADLSQGLPVADNSIDLVLASHSLEHIDNLMNMMKEIYRVCRHGAQVCIVAPYYHQGLNIANPYHKQAFNEHTPRFWTNVNFTLIDSEEYVHPHAPTWGLSESDQSHPGIDLRCLRMEYFYFPEYRHFSQQEKRTARKKYLDVCDQIMYNLVVIKQAVSEVEMKELLDRIEYYEPPYITTRRFQDRCESLEQTLDLTQEALARREAELEQVRNSLASREAELAELRTKVEGQEEKLRGAERIVEEQERKLEEFREALKKKEADLNSALAMLKSHETEFEKLRTELQNAQSAFESQQTELERVRRALAERDGQIDQERRTRGTIQGRLDQVRHKAESIARELDLFRNSKVTRELNRFLNKPDFRSGISTSFQQLIDDSLIFTSKIKGFRLLPSVNLQKVSFVYYPLELNRPGLKGILLAPILDLPPRKGVLGIEIVSPANSILFQGAVPVCKINESGPTCFDFPVIQDTGRGRFWLRVFARNVDVSVRIFEWQRYSIFGVGPLQTRGFCGYLFESVFQGAEE